MEQKATSHTEQIGIRKLNRTSVKQICFVIDPDNNQPHTLTFKQKNGVQDALKYMQLTGEHYIPNKGIILFYSQATVTLLGQQLDLLYKELTQQKVSLITVDGLPYRADKLEKDVAIIHSIKIEYHDSKMDDYITKLEEANYIRNGHANDEKKGED